MRITYGRNRNMPKIKNGYEYVHLKDTKFEYIEQRIKAFGHWIQATKPHEIHLPLCKYCKLRGHVIADCPKIAAQQCTICQKKDIQLFTVRKLYR